MGVQARRGAGLAGPWWTGLRGEGESSAGPSQGEKVEHLRLTEVRKPDTSPRLLGQNQTLFETRGLGLLQGTWRERSPSSLMGDVLAFWGPGVTSLTSYPNY